MTGATSKCICGAQPPESDLSKICALLFTLLTLSGAVCPAPSPKNIFTSALCDLCDKFHRGSQRPAGDKVQMIQTDREPQ